MRERMTYEVTVCGWYRHRNTGNKGCPFFPGRKENVGGFEKSNLIYGGPGEVCQNAEDIYGSVLRTVNALMKKSGVSPKQVAAMGIDAQMAGIMQWMLTLKRLALMIPGWIPGVNRISIQ